MALSFGEAGVRSGRHRTEVIMSSDGEAVVLVAAARTPVGKWERGRAIWTRMIIALQCLGYLEQAD